jgi:exopolyphosphatase / guanosine-5'-triphosphate,3'-diphosphate pyrophosphatase
MTLAAIDIGTNSVKMLIGRVAGRIVTPLLHRAVTTRLGEGLQRTGEISQEAADRTLATLAEFRALAQERGAERIEAVGTLALRAAKNGPAFVQRCAREAGLEIRILTGEQEARLSFQGAAGASEADQVLGIEIGGGSTQIMVGARAKLHASWSLAMGAVTLTEEFLRTDPPAAEEMLSMSAAIRRHLQNVVARVGKDGELVGVGGTVSAILTQLRKNDGGDPREFHQTRVSFETISALSIHLSLKTVAERERMGIEKGRADIITAGAWILTAAMSHLEATTLRASAHGLRHGLLIEMASSRTA